MEDSISFAFTSIEEIPEDAIEAICKGNVRRLDFTECQLRHMEKLSLFPNLEVLILDKNDIENPVFLDLNQPDPEDVVFYRSAILYRLPNLEYIDDKAVTDQDRDLAAIRGPFTMTWRIVVTGESDQAMTQSLSSKRSNDMFGSEEGEGEQGPIGYSYSSRRIFANRRLEFASEEDVLRAHKLKLAQRGEPLR